MTLSLSSSTPHQPTSHPTPSTTPSHPTPSMTPTQPSPTPTTAPPNNSTAPNTSCELVTYYGQTTYNGHYAYQWMGSSRLNMTPYLVIPSHSSIVTNGMKSITITRELPHDINSQELTIDEGVIAELAASGARVFVIHFKAASPDFVSTNYNPLSWQPSDGSQDDSILLDASEVKCIQTMKITIMKVQFTQKSSGQTYQDCDTSNQRHVSSSYFEYIDIYNGSQRVCSSSVPLTFVSHTSEAVGKFVWNGDLDVVPLIQIKVEKTRYCCGGVFYTQFGAEQHLRSTLATSPDYPQPYHLGMECPYIFRCVPQHLGARCVIKLDFIDFQLALGEQHNRGPWETADGVGGSGVCAGRDRIQVSPHGSFHKGHFVFCHGHPPIASITAHDQVLVHFTSVGRHGLHGWGDRGFVISYVALDSTYCTYSDKDFHPPCECGRGMLTNTLDRHSILQTMNQMEKYELRSKGRKISHETMKENGKKRKTKKKTHVQNVRAKQNKQKTLKTNKENEKGKKKQMKKKRMKTKGKEKINKENEKDKKQMKKKRMKTKGKEKIKKKSHRNKKKNTKLGKNPERMKTNTKNRQTQERKKKLKLAQENKTKRKNKKRKKNKDKTKKEKEKTKEGSSKEKMKDTEKEIEEENTDGEKESEDKEDIKDTDSYNTIQEMGNEDEGAKQPGSVQGVIPTNNRDKFPYLVSIIQFKLRKRRRKKPKEAASTKKKKVVRLCSGSIINHKFVLTTTSCCTYCWDIWNKKFKKQQPTTHSSHQEGKRGMSNTTNSSMQPTTSDSTAGFSTSASASDSSLQPQNIERSLSSLSDLHQSTQIEQSRVRKKKVSTSKGRKDAKGKPAKRGPQKENIKKKKEKKTKKKKRRKRRRARPRLSDIKVAVGFSTLNKMELNTLPLDKVVSIWLPEECAEKMNKRKKNKLVFPVECPVLLELSESIEFGPFVSPLCLPIFRTFNPNFLIGGSITYWSASGDTKLTSLTPSLLPGIVRLSASVCQIKLGGKLPHTTMMCTLALPDSTTGQNQSMCFGDEGAPFLSYTLPHYGHTEYLSAYAILAISGCKKAPKIKDKPKPSKPTRPKPKPTKPKPEPSKPTKPKPGPSKPTKQKPGPSKPTKPKPGPSKPTKPKPGPSKPTKPKPGPSKPTKPKPGPSKPTKPKPGPSKPTKPKPGPSKPTKPKPGPSNPTKPKPGPSKPTKPKPGPSKPTKPKPGSSKPRQPTKPGPHKTKPKPSKTEPKLIKRMRKPQTIKKSEKKPKKVKKDKESQSKQKGSKKKKKRKKRKPKKYNKKKTTNSGIDVWVEIAPYINWIIKVVFQGDDDLVCQRSSIEPQ